MYSNMLYTAMMNVYKTDKLIIFESAMHAYWSIGITSSYNN